MWLFLMGVGLWCIVAYLHPISIYYTLFFVRNPMNNEIEIEDLEEFLEELAPDENWSFYYGERRLKKGRKTTVKRYLFVVCYHARAWRHDFFFQVVEPALRSTLGLPWSKWPRKSKWFELSLGKFKWRDTIVIPGSSNISYQMYGMPVPKRKGDLLKCYFQQPAREWWEMV